MNAGSSEDSHESKEYDLVGMFPRKRRKRTIIAAEQLLKLEELYRQEQWPGREKKEDLAREIEMSTHFVNIWFQNKRSRVKKLAQEEEELKAMKSKLLGESDSKKKIIIAPKIEPRVGMKEQQTQRVGPSREGKPAPVISAPIRPVRPAMRGLPVVALGAGPSQLSAYLPNLTRMPIPFMSQKPMFTTLPVPLYHLRSKDVVKSIFPAPKRPEGKPMGLASRADRTIEEAGATEHRRRNRIKQVGLQGMPTTTSTSRYSTSLSSESEHAFDDVLLPESNQALANNNPSSSRQSRQQTVFPRPTTNQGAEPTRRPDQEVPATGTTLFRCLTLMMALAESPGAVPPGTEEFDLAVCASLYGVKLAKGSILTYDQQVGFRVEKSAKKSKKGKNKNGKSKKRRRKGKKK